LCDGRTVGARVAEWAGVPLAQLAELLAWATDPGVQAGQWRAEPLLRPDPALARLVGAPREGRAQTSDLAAFHAAITDGPTHFDDVETTVAHAHAIPHPALHGRTYGQALADALGWWPEPGITLEIGPGDGELAAAIRPRADPARWIRLDLSPGLLAESGRRNPGSPGIVGDATRLPFPAASVRRVVANEMIADLPSDPAAGRNTGALALIGELARVLVPGGTAFLSEFGGADGLADSPLAVTEQLDHPEVSIDFVQLAAAAEPAGLAARLVRLDELLGFDRTARQVWRPHYEGLRALCAADGHHLAARAWTPTDLAAALGFPVDGVRFVPIDTPGPGPLVTRFWALILTRR
jgi:SAM-dependent methyltransferase